VYKLIWYETFISSCKCEKILGMHDVLLFK